MDETPGDDSDPTSPPPTVDALRWSRLLSFLSVVGAALSTVAAPDGSVLARAGAAAGELVFADLDPTAYEAYRTAHRYADQLRRDLYPAPQRLRDLR